MKIVPKAPKHTPPVWRPALCCLLLLGAFAACGPGDEQGELVDLEEAQPAAGSSEETLPAEPGKGPGTEDVPLERAPVGPELEAPEPSDEATVTDPGEEMPVDPEELEEEIDAAEPVPPAPAPLPAAETEAAGKEVFLAQRCDTCHGVSSAGIEGKTASGGDLTGVGERLDRAGTEAVLRGEETAGGKPHPKKFSGGQEELDALIDWLLAQG